MERRDFIRLIGGMLAAEGAKRMGFGILPEAIPAEEADVFKTQDQINQERMANDRKTYSIYEQYELARGIFIKAPAAVDPEILDTSKLTIETMLRHIPDVQQILIDKFAQIIILPKNMKLLQLPEFKSANEDSSHKGIFTNDMRSNTLVFERGNISAVGEESFYDPSSPIVLIHEFAHLIKLVAFTPRQFMQVIFLYSKYFTSDIFRGASIMKDFDEFWAIASQVYFAGLAGFPQFPPKLINGLDTPDKLKKAAPDLYNYLASFYEGRADK